MTEPFVQAAREWQNFYFVMGSASATLIGLMFVAVSVVILLLVSVKNTWDLMLWIAQNRQTPPKS